ncbi:MAG: T9SS type A sorting domain-containing protein [Sphingobacteriales bacterium]|nr:MAG: T9SS type A sorting domain-containing protein [Sphingobacteriales bacterium]
MDNQYEDWDNHPLNGMNLYRLKITDLDGSFTHSDVKKVFFVLTQDKSISIYPNPNKGTFTVELAHPQNAVINIIITDISGRRLYQLNTTGNKYVINDATLSAGLYLITVQDGNSWYCEKLIIE